MRPASPNILNTNVLLEKYRQRQGKQFATADELFQFLTKDSPDRRQFLTEHCDIQLKAMNKSAVPIATPR